MSSSNPFRLTWLLSLVVVRVCYGLVVVAITVVLAALAGLPLVAAAVAAYLWIYRGHGDWAFATYVVLFFFSGFYMKAWQAMTDFPETSEPADARSGGRGAIIRGPWLNIMDSFGNYHRRLWAWCRQTLSGAVQFTGWWVGVSFVIWLTVVTLTPAFLLANCVLNARAGALGMSDILSTIVLSAFAIPVIRMFPPTKVWGLAKDLWHGLPFILNVMTFGLLRVAQRHVRAVAAGLPTNCELRQVQTQHGPAWGVIRHRVGESGAKLIGTGASRKEALQNARKFLGRV